MMNRKLLFFNSKTGVKELFTASDQPTMYVCGVTPYDYAHLGHARCYVSFDVLYRLLQFWGYRPLYVRNVTDVDDKIVCRGEAECQGAGDLLAASLAVAQKYTAAFNEDLTRLGVKQPDKQPLVSEHIDDIIAFVQHLIAKGHAYVVEGDVYFDVTSSHSYGSLSGRKLDDLIAGARVSVADKKRNPADFALWKGDVVGSFWQSPWGPGRPGWHIECSALVRKYIGETVDIHGGGIDLIFPHHENEVAQSEGATGAPLARYWVHNAHVTLHKEKMSKSLGNTFTIRDMLAGQDPVAVRFYLLQHHYRSPLDIDLEHLKAAAKAYARLVKALNPAGVPIAYDATKLRDDSEQLALTAPVVRDILEAFADDMNIAKALGIIFGALDELVRDEAVRVAVVGLLSAVAGLPCLPLQDASKVEAGLTPEIEALLAAREQARAQKNWARADELRNQIMALGHAPADKKA